jgi:uncharacterized membrane protein YdjX (TVP38/TMEM64 family)
MRVKVVLLAAVIAAVVCAPVAAHFLWPGQCAVLLVRGVGALHGMGVAGGVLFIAGVCVLALIGVVPGALLGIAAGGVYGVVCGFITSAIGVLAGAIIAFSLSRSALRPLIAGGLGRRARLATLDAMVTRDAWRLVFLLRISPVMPFSLTSYALGLSGIAMRDYLIGTLAAMPPLLGYVVIGALGARGFSSQARATHLVLLGAGILATLALTLHLMRLLRRGLAKGVR